MTTTIRTVLFVLVSTFAALTASLNPSLALATDGRPTVTVRITDVAAVEHSIGACDSGYELRDINNSGSPAVSFRSGEATLVQPTSGNYVAPMFTCVGVVIGFPSSGVDVTMH